MVETKESIEPQPDEKDGRVKRIYPKEKCYSCSQRIGRCILDSDELMVGDFTPREKELFEALLLRAIHNLSGKIQEPQAQREEQL